MSYAQIGRKKATTATSKAYPRGRTAMSTAPYKSRDAHFGAGNKKSYVLQKRVGSFGMAGKSDGFSSRRTQRIRNKFYNQKRTSNSMKNGGSSSGSLKQGKLRGK